MIDYPSKWELRDKIRLSRSLFHIHGNEEFNFYQFLVDELLRLDRLNRKEPDAVLFRQRQGAGQVLCDLIELLENADEMHDTLKSSEGLVSASRIGRDPVL